MAISERAYRDHVAGLTPEQQAELVRRLRSTARRTTSTAIPRRSRARGIPLSPAQRGIWFVQSMDPSSAVYNMAIRLQLRGPLDIAALAAALTGIVERHDVLRTTYIVRDDLPEQVVAEPAAVAIAHADLSDRAKTDRIAEAERVWSSDAVRPFDLAHDAMLRARLLKLDADDHVLILVTHHIACDGASIAVFARELEALYNAHARKQASPLGPLPLEHADYAAWSASRLTGGELERSLAYWRQQLRDPLPETPRLAGRTTRRTGSSGAAATVPFACAAGGSTRPASTWSFAWALAGFQALVHASSGAGEFLLGTDVSGRDRLELEPLIGCLVNQVVLRADLAGDPTFAEVVSRAQQSLDQALAHKDVPFDELVQAINPRRGGRPSPLFELKIVGNPWLGKSKSPEWQLTGLDVDALIAYPRTTGLDLTAFVHNGPAGITGTLEYDTACFDRPAIDTLLRDFAIVVNEAAANPGVRLSRLRAAVTTTQGHAPMTLQTTTGGPKAGGLRGLKPKPLATIAPSGPRTSYPYGDGLMVIESGDPASLRDWAASHVADLEAGLATHGAILFRGLPLASPADMESFARLFCSDLYDENGEHPRETDSGAVYSPVFYPPEEKLLWHNENSFNLSWPMRIWFGCVQPAEQGGETPIADSRKVYERLDQGVRRRFADRGVMYVRNYQAGMGLDWQHVFQTTSRADVEKRCQAESIAFEWRDGGLLRTRMVRPAAARHPDTGVMTWFNQAQHWHPACLDPATRESLRELFAEADFPRHCYYGDGSPIDDSVMHEILGVYRELEIAFPWRASDVVMLDNMATAHARNPFRGRRKILVAMGRMTSWDISR